MTTDPEIGGPLPEKKSAEEIAFINAKMDEVELNDKPVAKPAAKFIGLTKEELSTFADDPSWVRTRRLLFVGFWVIWLAMIVAAAAIIAVTPRCPAKPPQKWWDSGVVYRVYVKSYKDSNDDGTGDLVGLQSSLDYVSSLGVSALSLSSFFQTASSNDSATSAASIAEGVAGDDVTDFMEPDSAVGSLKDVKELVKKARKIGLKVLLEIDPNLSSDQHRWFLDSAAGLPAFRDYYVWRNSSGSASPTLWTTDKKEKVWHFNDQRKEWFYSRVGPKYPELNFGSSSVKIEVKRILDYWLDEGIDGFVLQSAAFLYEDPLASQDGFVDRSESIKFVAELRKLIDDKCLASGRDLALVVDARDISGEQRIQDSFYHDGTNPGAHVVLNNGFVDAVQCAEAECVQDVVKKTLDLNEDSKAKLNVEVRRLWPNWVSSDPHLKQRLGSRLAKPGLNDAVNLIMLTMEGSAFFWFGDEIGMSNSVYSPMQWDNSANAGFTSGDPWLPVGADSAHVNVKFERALGNDRSVLKTFETTSGLRSEPSIAYGTMTLLPADERLFSFIRHAEGHAPFYVAVNFGDADTTIPVGIPSEHPKSATVVSTTANIHRSIVVGKKVDLEKEDILLKPGEGIVLKLG